MIYKYHTLYDMYPFYPVAQAAPSFPPSNLQCIGPAERFLRCAVATDGVFTQHQGLQLQYLWKIGDFSSKHDKNSDFIKKNMVLA